MSGDEVIEPAKRVTAVQYLAHDCDADDGKRRSYGEEEKATRFDEDDFNKNHKQVNESQYSMKETRCGISFDILNRLIVGLSCSG